MPYNPEEEPFNPGDLVREHANFKAQRESAEQEYQQDLLGALREVREALAYLVARERQREKAESAQGSQS